MLPDLSTPYLDGVDCLLAPVEPGESGESGESEKFPVLRSRYDSVAIDTPGPTSSRVLAALYPSDHFVLAKTLDTPALERVRDRDPPGTASRTRRVFEEASYGWCMPLGAA